MKIKNYNIKVYTTAGEYVRTFSPSVVMNGVSFTAQKNGGQGEMRVRLNIPFTSAAVAYNNIIKVYETDDANPNGRQIYMGIVGSLQRISESGAEYVEMRALGLASMLSWVYYDNAGNNIFTKNQEPAETIKNIIDTFRLKYPGYTTQDLLALYEFAWNADDTSWNGYNGTVNGATLTTNRNGISNSAYQFNGAEWIELLDTPFDITTNVTYCFSVNFDAITQWQRILSKYANTSTWHFEAYILSSNKFLILFRWSSTNNPLISNKIISIWEWYDIIIRFNNTTWLTELFINWVFDSSNFQQIWMSNNTANMVIWKIPIWATYPYFLRWKIEYVAIYNRILSDSEISQLKDSIRRWTWLIKYTGDSIEDTGATTNLSFNYNKANDALKKVLETVNQWWWTVDGEGNMQFHPRTGAIGQTHHKLTYSGDIDSITAEEDLEKLVNSYTLDYTGGTTTATDATSQGLYGIRELKENKTEITNSTTAAQAANGYIEKNKNPVRRISLTVNSEYDFESIKPGDLVTVRNLEYDISSLQISKIEYNPDIMRIELEDFKSFSNEVFNT